ncbi:Abscisic acid receptor PYL4 [Glycine soja]|nr:Abscisic acid receptor PYL4 [Glycine soja]
MLLSTIVLDVVARHHTRVVSPQQWCPAVVQKIDASVSTVWSVVRRYDNPRTYNHFIRSCHAILGTFRDIHMISGLLTAVSTERLTAQPLFKPPIGPVPNKELADTKAYMEGEKKGKGAEETEPCHKPKNGSIFPKERTSVKRMMYEKGKQVVVDCVKSTAKKASVSPAPEASKSNNQ